MKKLPLGTIVRVGHWEDGPCFYLEKAEVIHHGRDVSGIYTRVKFVESGKEIDYNRDNLYPEARLTALWNDRVASYFKYLQGAA